MNRYAINKLSHFLFLAVMVTACKARSRSNENLSKVKVAGASTASNYLKSISTPELKAAAEKIIRATAHLSMPQGVCSGTVVSPIHVVTAAHCFRTESYTKMNSNLNAKVTVGGYTYNGKMIAFADDYLPQPEGEPNSDKSDIAIVEISPQKGRDLRSSTDNRPIIPIKIANSDLEIRDLKIDPNDEKKIAFAEQGFVLGFGLTNANAKLSSSQTLHIKEIEFAGQEHSSEKMLAINVRGFGNNYLGGKPGVICSGDSGGPTILLFNGIEPILVGVNSMSDDCGSAFFYLASDVRIAGSNKSFLRDVIGKYVTFTNGKSDELPSTNSEQIQAPQEQSKSVKSNPVHSKPVSQSSRDSTLQSWPDDVCAYASARGTYATEVLTCMNQLQNRADYVGIRKTQNREYSGSHECVKNGKPKSLQNSACINPK